MNQEQIDQITAEVRVAKREALIKVIAEIGGRYRETPVKLAGGGETHVYLDVKGILTNGNRINLAADVMLATIAQLGLEPTAVGGPTMGADVLSHAMVSRSNDLEWFSVRDFAKTDHGLGRWIEGKEIGPGDKVILTDDVASTGKSLIESYERIIATGAQVLAVIPLVDRAGKTGPRFAELGVPYFPVIDYSELGLTPLGS